MKLRIHVNSLDLSKQDSDILAGIANLMEDCHVSRQIKLRLAKDYSSREIGGSFYELGTWDLEIKNLSDEELETSLKELCVANQFVQSEGSLEVRMAISEIFSAYTSLARIRLENCSQKGGVAC